MIFNQILDVLRQASKQVTKIPQKFALIHDGRMNEWVIR